MQNLKFEPTEFKKVFCPGHSLDGQLVKVISTPKIGYALVEALTGPHTGVRKTVHLMLLRPGLSLVG